MYRTVKVLFFLIIVMTSSAVAQKGTHSPYSSFGIGELKTNDYAAYRSMGGISIANTDSTMVNHSNPASYAFIGRFRPIFQVGLDGRLSTFETTDNSTNQRFFGLNQFQLGIPIKKRWGATIGLKPYSFTGYQISNYITDTLSDGEIDTTQLFTNEGSGGTNQFFIGVGYQPLKKTTEAKKYVMRKDSLGNEFKDSIYLQKTNYLSIGANANYLFGSSRRIRSFQYASLANGYNSKVINSLRVSGFLFDFGVNYQYSWTASNTAGKGRKTNSISVGATYSPAMKVKAFQDLYSYSYINFGGFNGSDITVDTVEYIDDNEGNIYIPESYKLGFEYRIGPNGLKNSNLLKIGGDVKYQKWSAYNEEFGEAYSNTLKDRLGLSLGLEWTPAAIPDLRTPFFNKIHYRLGFNYTMTELSVLDNSNNYTDLTSYGMSFGLGIPITIIQNSNTNINFGANLGKLGTTENGLIRENYVGLFFGVSITPGRGDLWFLKRKYD